MPVTPTNVQEVADGPRYIFLQADVADRPGHDRRYALDSGKLHANLDWTAGSPVIELLVHSVTGLRGSW